MKIGLFLYEPLPYNRLTEAVEKLSGAGFTGFELRTSRSSEIESELDPVTRTNINEYLQNSEVKLTNLNSACAYHYTDPDEVTANVEETKKFVELALDLGAPAVKVRPDGLQIDKGVEAEATLEQIGRALRECAMYAEDYGVQLWLEMHGSGTSHPPYIQYLMQYVDHPLVKVCWNCNQSDFDETGSFETYFNMVQPWVVHVHLHDLFNKSYPYAALHWLLKEIGYDGYIISENPANDSPERLAEYYQEIMAKLGT